ncbi:hypothetical protein PQX77_010119 [Marasmius sp. AFHP31]|nr:hypothetical protein PQX77_010119 [Marasmius sp. AFHP31]
MPQGTMKALWYNAPRDFEIKQVPIPQINDDEVLLKVTCCGMCGTDGHIHDGTEISFHSSTFGRTWDLTKYGYSLSLDMKLLARSLRWARTSRASLPVTDVWLTSALHVATASIAAVANLFSVKTSTPVVLPRMVVSQNTSNSTHQSKLYKIHNLTDEESTLLEPAACAIHGLDKLNPPVGIEVLLLGAGPTGLILAQLLKQNGASRVVIAANKGIKMDIAKDLEAADEYIELDRQNPEPQWQKLKDDNPYGFDVVVEATGVEKLANESINYVRRGGTLMIYGVYENKALVHWPPSKIFGDEIRIIGSFSQTFCFPRAVAYLDSGKVKVKGMVTDVYKLEDFQSALDKMNSRGALKIAIKP